MDYLTEGGIDAVLQASPLVDSYLERLNAARGPLKRVLLLPPDFTRFHSGAGWLACLLYDRLHRTADVQVLPTLGTHDPMSPDELEEMYPGIPSDRFHVHDWKNGVKPLGEVPAEFIRKVSDGKLDWSVSVEINRLLTDTKWDAIISIGQLVPHEVVGIANHNKNVFVGAGGRGLIHTSHYLGAVHGIERIMGQIDTPVRAVLDYASEHLAKHLPIVYLLTVRARDATGRIVTRGLFGGDDRGCYEAGAKLCRQVNLDRLPRAPKTCVVYLDPKEFKSTWLGNKAIYRTRMAMADGGNLIILAPGVRKFGEQEHGEIDRLIREFGYRGTDFVLDAVKRKTALADSLAAAAHLIQGSSEGRFDITYCPGHLSRTEIEGVNFKYGDLSAMLAKYDIRNLTDGWNDVDGEEVHYISNPALGLWGTAERFDRA